MMVGLVELLACFDFLAWVGCLLSIMGFETESYWVFEYDWLSEPDA